MCGYRSGSHICKNLVDNAVAMYVRMYTQRLCTYIRSYVVFILIIEEWS